MNIRASKQEEKEILELGVNLLRRRGSWRKFGGIAIIGAGPPIIGPGIPVLPCGGPFASNGGGGPCSLSICMAISGGAGTNGPKGLKTIVITVVST